MEKTEFLLKLIAATKIYEHDEAFKKEEDKDQLVENAVFKSFRLTNELAEPVYPALYFAVKEITTIVRKEKSGGGDILPSLFLAIFYHVEPAWSSYEKAYKQVHEYAIFKE